MKITLSLDHIDSLKPGLAGILPALKPAHRVEALARAIGFSTYAAARAKLLGGVAEVALTREPFVTFVRQRAEFAEADLTEAWAALSSRLMQGVAPALTSTRRHRKSRLVRETDIAAAQLVLVVGPVRSGKTRLTQDLMKRHPKLRLFDAIEGEIRAARDAGKLLTMLADGPVIANLHAWNVGTTRARLESVFGDQMASVSGKKVLVIATRLLARADGDGEVLVQEAGWLGWAARPVERMLTPGMANAAARLIDSGTVSMASAVQQFRDDIPANHPLFEFYRAPGRTVKIVRETMATVGLGQEFEAAGPLTLGQSRLLAIMMHLTRTGPVTGISLQQFAGAGIETGTVYRLYRRWATLSGVAEAVQVQLVARFNRVTPQQRIQVLVRWPDQTGTRVLQFDRVEADTMLKPFGVVLPPDSLSDIDVTINKDGSAGISYVLQNGNWAHAGPTERSLGTGSSVAVIERRQRQLLAALPAKVAAWRALLASKRSARDHEQEIRVRLQEVVRTIREGETTTGASADAYHEAVRLVLPVKTVMRIEDPPEILIPALGPIGRTCRTRQAATALALWLAPPTPDPIWGDAAQAILRGFISGLQQSKPGRWDWPDLKALCELPDLDQRAYLDQHDPDAAGYLVFNEAGRLNRTSSSYMSVVHGQPYRKIAERASSRP